MLLVVGSLVIDACCSPVVDRCLLFGVGRIARCWLLIVRDWWLVVCCCSMCVVR